MFKKILIANRGAVARRVNRAARGLGVKTVAVYSEADAALPHVREADEAHAIGPAPAAASYLDIGALLEAARRSGADAVHPGYGFLSEKPEFAQAVLDAGLAFIGPSPRWLDAMGHKTRAKVLMKDHGMPMCPSSDVLSGSAEERVARAAAVGFPLLVKPAGGGGGIGMLAAHDEASLASAIERAGSLAARSFGNGELYVERLLQRPRHVEFQLLADRHGSAMHLYERDCSVQRRHQKVIEEAGAPGLAGPTADAMAGRATAIMQGLGYDNIGTVETLYEPEVGFSFLEMNTRLQVEHGVTEEITGVDIVASQIRLAYGERLSEVIPMQPPRNGHAIQLRVYAEDPLRFIPSPGPLEVFRPPEMAGVRIESGFAEGDRVTPYYDPMIAKLIVHAADRPAAIRKALEAVRAFRIEGLKTNLPFLAAVLESPEFAAGAVHTGLAAEITQRMRAAA